MKILAVMKHHKLALCYRWPRLLFVAITKPVPPGLWLINFFHQRVLRINSACRCQVHFTSRVSGRVSLGRNVWKSLALSGGCYIQGINGIEIGDDTLIAPGVKIISANHDPADFNKWERAEPIRIGKRCWIGANAVILPNVHLGDDIIVGAGSVVTKCFSSACTIAGVPAVRLTSENSRPCAR